eukprot:SAG22_NODE_1231_length_5073_cov_16.438480_1_plen_267_part_00
MYETWAVEVVAVPCFLAAVCGIMFFRDRHVAKQVAEQAAEEKRLKLATPGGSDGVEGAETEESDKEPSCMKGMPFSLFKSRLFTVAFVIYPMVCRKNFSFFNCRTLGGNSGRWVGGDGVEQQQRWEPHELPELGTPWEVLGDDYRINCHGKEHFWSQVVAGIVIAGFVVAVPVALSYKLWAESRQRREHDGMDEDERRKFNEHKWISNQLASKLDVDNRDAEDAINELEADSFSFLNTFKASYFYWESMDMIRKLVLCGMLVFAGE